MCSERYVRYVHLCARRSKEKSEGPNQTMQATDKKTVTAFGLLCGPRLGSPQSENQRARAPVPWVSTDLRILRPEPAWRLAPDFAMDARCYRKLDPEYFAWLRSRMLEVSAAHKAGRVSQAAFDELRRRFNELQESAIALFGETALQDAIRASGFSRYRPPAPDAPSGRRRSRGRCSSRPGAGTWLDPRAALRPSSVKRGREPAMPDERTTPSRNPHRPSHAPVDRDHRPAASREHPAVVQPGRRAAVGGSSLNQCQRHFLQKFPSSGLSFAAPPGINYQRPDYRPHRERLEKVRRNPKILRSPRVYITSRRNRETSEPPAP